MAAVDETLLQEDPIASEACDRISAWYRRAARDLWTTLAPPGGGELPRRQGDSVVPVQGRETRGLK